MFSHILRHAYNKSTAIGKGTYWSCDEIPDSNFTVFGGDAVLAFITPACQFEQALNMCQHSIFVLAKG